MVKFFFYDKLTNVEVLKKISNDCEIYDGYIIIQNYDSENNFLEISDVSINNNKILYGKIVDFNMKFEDIIRKLNETQKCKTENKRKYTIETIWANKFSGGTYKAYIIY
uniref:Gamma-glutamylcyclotransferase AIG2-like domain-containing protein n=1 Tax=viral metagenome TaxID=1070528 RepID=A0A6C0BA63_9ZZZZ